MIEGQTPDETFEFYPLEWLINGYKLDDINAVFAEKLEKRKVKYMEDRGYVADATDGYDASLERTSRLVVVDGTSGK